MSQENDFAEGHKYRIAYKPTRHAKYHSNLDVELCCPQCKCNLWLFSKRTGTKVLSKDQVKFKCSGCGQWFICNTNEVTKILGVK